MSAASRAARALVAAVLLLCPSGFRDEYGRAIRGDFARTLARERSRRGPLGALAYTFVATFDLVATASTEYRILILRDLVYAFRSLCRAPLFTSVIVATLAVAIGANAAVFSILNAVVLAPLPYAQPDRLVALRWQDGTRDVPCSLPEFAGLVRDASGTFSGAAAFANSQMTLTGEGAPQYLATAIATAGLFSTLGIAPQLGAFPSQAQTRAGAAPPVVLSNELWRSTFGADPKVVGSLVRLDGTAYHVVAIAPATFRQPSIFGGFERTQIWRFVPDDGTGTPYTIETHRFFAVARLAPGVSLARANAAIDRAAGALRRAYPNDDRNLGASAVTLADSLVGSQRGLLFGIFAAVIAVLIVACANVANLLLSRAATREREISVRTAIGASRARIVAQLLVEASLLAVAGGALGIALARGIVAAFGVLHPASIPRADDVTIGVPTLLFTLGAVAAATIVAGLAPALTASRVEVATALASAGRGGDSHRGARARNGFVAAEIAITLAIVIAAGLVVRSFAALTAQPLGFDPAGVAAFTRIDLPVARYGDGAAVDAYQQRALAAVRAVGGVRHAAWTWELPFESGRFSTYATIAGRSYLPGEGLDVALEIVSAEYFPVLHASVIAGRDFTDDDRAGTLPVAIVNESFVRRYLPNGHALGTRIATEYSENDEPNRTERTIVGVVADLRQSYLAPPVPTAYLPMRQFPRGASALLVAGTAGSSAGVVRALRSVDPALPAPSVTLLSRSLANDVAARRLAVVALGSLGTVALVLSAAGIFAVVSFGVTQRTHEFGVRMALGAPGRRVLLDVLLRALRLAAIGIAAGLVLSAACMRYLEGELFDTSPIDPATFASVTALLIGVALVAAIVPALRATRVDPIVALRYE